MAPEGGLTPLIADFFNDITADVQKEQFRTPEPDTDGVLGRTEAHPLAGLENACAIHFGNAESASS